MERQQHQHWAKPPQPPLSERSRQQGRTSKAAFSFSKPGLALTLLVLGSAWAVVVVIALTAVGGLLSPNASNGHYTPGAATLRETAETSRTSGQARIPLWLFGAIALSCAAGSMLISKQANRPPHPRKSTRGKRLMSSTATTVSTVVQLPAPQSPLPYPPAVPSFVLNSVQRQHPSTVAAPFTAPTLIQLAHQEAQSKAGQTDVSVTVIPSEDTHPLDWGEASLADKLDIRKPRSISSLL